MKIKADCACNALDMNVAEGLGVDYVGVRLGKDTRLGDVLRPRCVGNMPDIVPDGVSSEEAEDAVDGMKLVGIFADDMMQDVLTAVYNFKLDVVQLNGNEGATYVRNLLLTIVPDIRGRLSVIKDVVIESEADFCKCVEYEGVVDMFVFHISQNACGELSADRCREILAAYQGSTPFLLAVEGIGSDVAVAAAQTVAACCGVDAATAFAADGGGFDSNALHEFVSLCGRHGLHKESKV